jgi:beta-N-acetylhexosaminidase
MLAAILGLSGPDLTGDEARFLARHRPWGVILFRRNIDHGPGGADRLRRLVDDLRGALDAEAPVFVDQEGGTVQRLRPPLARDWADANVQAGGARAVWLRHRLMADELRSVGIDADCAPVIDLGGPATHPFLRRRIWADDPATLIPLARAACDGLRAGGVLPVIKHLPGHGSADADSHHALPRDARALADLAGDFAVVRALADQPLGMTAHVVFDALDPDLPATLSPRALAHLRGDLGFDGLLMTDDIEMNALGGPMADRAARAIAAGCDLVLHCSGDLAGMAAVAEAAGPLTNRAAERAARALALRVAPPAIDTAALWAELEARQDGGQGGAVA